jgi:hypothetical protein
MLLGMTHGEIGLVLFVFGLTWGAVLVPRLGERLGDWLAGGSKRAKKREG